MDPLHLEDYRPADLMPLVRMWREAFEHGVGIVDPHTLQEQADYFEREVHARQRVQLVRSGALVVGFVAADAESVSQLHVRVGWHRRGIGRMLLDRAKAGSGGGLWLYTFARNRVARAFYESQGFVAVQHGFEPTWQLEDVKYAWPAPAAHGAGASDVAA